LLFVVKLVTIIVQLNHVGARNLLLKKSTDLTQVTDVITQCCKENTSLPEI